PSPEISAGRHFPWRPRRLLRPENEIRAAERRDRNAFHRSSGLQEVHRRQRSGFPSGVGEAEGSAFLRLDHALAGLVYQLDRALPSVREDLDIRGVFTANDKSSPHL